MQVVAAAAMEPPAGHDAATIKDAHVRAVPRDPGRRPGPLRPRPVRRLPRRSTACADDSTTETYAALRLEVDNWRWSGVPFFIRTGKLPAGHADRAAARLPASRRGSASTTTARTRPEPDQLVVKLDPTTGVRLLVEAQRGGRRRAASRSTSTWSSPTRAARARRPTRSCCTPRCRATARASRARTASRRRGGSCSRCSTRRRPCSPTRPGSWGPGGRRPPARRPRPLARPVGGVMSATGQKTPQRGARRASRTAAERRRAVAVHADRRVRVPVELPHRRAGRARRRDRLAVRPALRLAERVRRAARPRGRQLPARAVRHQRPDRPRLRAGHEHARHDLAHAERLGRRARRADDGAARARGHDHAAHAAAGRRRRRPPAGAHRHVHRRHRRDRARLRARVRLRPHARRVGAASATTATPPTRPATGQTIRLRTDMAMGIEGNRVRARHTLRGGRAAVLRALVGRGPRRAGRRRRRPKRGSRRRRASGARGSAGARMPDHRWRAPIQRSRAGDQGPHLHADRRDRGRAHDVAARDARRRAQLGLPLHVDPRLDVHAAGAALAQPRLGGRRVHAVRRRPRAQRRRRRCRSCTGSTAAAT